MKDAFFEGRDALKEFVHGHERRTTRHAHHDHFERGTWLTTTHDVVEGAGKTLVQTREIIRVGSFGDMSCFSFYANKIITTGEGGMLLTDDAEIPRGPTGKVDLARLRQLLAAESVGDPV